jgi:hypothetical protein
MLDGMVKGMFTFGGEQYWGLNLGPCTWKASILPLGVFLGVCLKADKQELLLKKRLNVQE